jgi:hypothetical protein
MLSLAAAQDQNVRFQKPAQNEHFYRLLCRAFFVAAPAESSATRKQWSGYAAARISRLNGRTSKFGWLQASATRNYSSAISSEHPATIRIDSRPPQYLDVASLRRRRSPMQSMTSYKPT